MNVINTQLDEQLEKAEFSLITSEYEQLTQILAAIDPKVIDESELIARYYYLKGFEMIFTNAPITDVLFHFDQLLMAETANTLFRLLAYTGIGMVYAREKSWKKQKFISIECLKNLYVSDSYNRRYLAGVKYRLSLWCFLRKTVIWKQVMHY